MTIASSSQISSFRKKLDRFILFLIGIVLLVTAYAILTGLPVMVGNHLLFKIKNLKGFALTTLILWAIHLALHPEGFRAGFLKFQNQVRKIAEHQYTLGSIYFISSLLFTWQQLTEFYSLEINFLPFSFYDYMLYYFFHGKIHFTGWLHGYYHHNIVMFFLAPLWWIFKSPLFLFGIYGFLASLSIFPLHAIAKERFKEPIAPFFIILTFLNFRYLQNLLQMNFCVEIFYSLFILSAIYMAMKRKWIAYYLFAALTLMVKEDSFIYVFTLGAFTFFYQSENTKQIKSCYRWHGIVTSSIALLYYVFLRKIYSPLIQSDIMMGNAANYAGYGDSVSDILLTFLKNPWIFLMGFFGSKVKLEVLFKLTSRLAFLPLFSPAFILVMMALVPLFLHNTGRDSDFVEMRFHYAGAILPFIFASFVFGFSNLIRKSQSSWKEPLRWMLCILLMAMNAGHYRTEHFNREHLESIAWTKSIPQNTVLVTHGHLLPYAGYREQNFYFAEPFEKNSHPANKFYANADYYLIDLSVNLYPMDKTFFEKKIQELLSDSQYKLIKQDKNIRYLFKKKQFINEHISSDS